MSCPECGVERNPMGLKWYISPGYRDKICSTCHSSESQWPSTMKNGGGREMYDYMMRESERVDGGVTSVRSCGHQCRKEIIYFAIPAMMSGNNRCCACVGSFPACSVCVPRTLPSVFRGNGLTAGFARELATSVLEDVTGKRYTVSKSIADRRKERLEGNVVRLYHQTDATAAEAILSSQQFRLGSPDCLAGSGIYFAVSAEDTQRKARFHGVILQADVFLGNVKTISFYGDKSITFKGLLDEGFDSVKIPRNGDELVVYSYDQVINIARLGERGCKVAGCRSCRGTQRHYCKNCRSGDADHRSRNCPYGRKR